MTSRDGSTCSMLRRDRSDAGKASKTIPTSSLSTPSVDPTSLIHRHYMRRSLLISSASASSYSFSFFFFFSVHLHFSHWSFLIHPHILALVHSFTFPSRSFSTFMSCHAISSRPSVPFPLRSCPYLLRHAYDRFAQYRTFIVEHIL